MKVLIAAVMTLVGARATACITPSVGDMVSGKKVVGIQIENGKKKKYLVDDDGLLTMSILADYCYQKVGKPLPKVELSHDEKTCLNKQGISFSPPPNVILGSDLRADVVKIYNEKCGVDIEKKIQDAKQLAANQPVDCADEVGQIAQKAADRYAEYVAEQTDPNYLASLSVPEEAKAEALANLRINESLTKDFAAFFNERPAKMDQFYSLLTRLHASLYLAKYRTVESMSDLKNKDKKQPELTLLYFMLGMLESELPWIGHSRCWDGKSAINKELIEKLNKVNWGKPTSRKSKTSTENGIAK